MGWFDEQIRERINNDDEMFSDAIAGMASVIMGERIGNALHQNSIITKNAIEEILKYYHIKIQDVPPSIKDLDGQLEYLMRPEGIMRRTVNLNDEWYKDAIGAMLAYRNDDETVIALIPGKFSGYKFYDTKTGKYISVNKHNANLINSEAICFYKPLPLRKLSIKDLLIFIIHSITLFDLIPVFLSTLIVTLVGLIIPKLNNIIYEYVISGKSYTLFFAVFGFLLCVNLSKILLETAQTLSSDKISRKIGLQFESASMMRMLSLPAKFFRNYSAGNLSMRMSYINPICQQITKMIFATGLTSVFSLAYITQMIKFGSGLVVPALLVIISTFTFSAITAFIEIRVSKASMVLAAKESGMNYALVSGIEKIKLSGAEKRAFAKWANLYQKSLKCNYDPPFFLKFSTFISTIISTIGTIVIYYFTIKKNIGLADYFAFTAAFGMVLGSFTSLLDTITSFARIKPMLEMVKPILETEPEITNDKKIVTKLSGGIEINNLSFRYNTDMPWVLDNLSLKIKTGEYVAIVGTTGCGKSTLLRLLMGFESPQKGSIYYDGKDINTLDLKSLRKNIGTVLQNGKLLQGDIFSNITITAPNLTLEDAWEAAKISGIDEDIVSMPMGMHTIISEGTGGISGGQKQRLLIARAVAPKPKILMFDEATSALDNITQKKVSDALTSLKCTRIVIAHRLSTIKDCDRIIVLDKGQIIEDDTYDNLIAHKGFFANLVERQQLQN